MTPPTARDAPYDRENTGAIPDMERFAASVASPYVCTPGGREHPQLRQRRGMTKPAQPKPRRLLCGGLGDGQGDSAASRAPGSVKSRKSLIEIVDEILNVFRANRETDGTRPDATGCLFI